MQRPTSIKLQRLTPATPEAIELAKEYEPYNSMLIFWLGYNDYHQDRRCSYDGVDAQAYASGLELAARLALREAEADR
jgi:hypothetical protein